MTIQKIKKIYLIAPSAHREALLEEIQRLGVIQLENLDLDMENDGKPDIFRVDEASVSELRAKEVLLNQILNAMGFLEQYIPPPSGFSLLTRGPVSVSKKREKSILADFDFQGFLLELKNLESRMKKLLVKKMSLENRRENLAPWRSLDVPLNYFRRTEHARIRALIVPAQNLEACRRAAEEAISELIAIKVGETRDQKNIVLIYHKEAEESAEKIMRDFDVHPAVFPSVPHTPKQVIQDIDKELETIRKKSLELESEIREMEEPLLYLRVIANQLDNSLDRKRAWELAKETSRSFVIKGWLPEDKMDLLENAVYSIAPETDFSVLDPEEDDDVPVILRNPPLIRPFESVLDIYGNPNYREFDPTISIGLFFFIGFGYCLTDAGYGLMLALIFGLGAWKLKLAPSAKKFFHLLTLCGISGVIMGILTGSWFGDLFTAEGFPVSRLGWGRFITRLQIIDPTGKHIMIFLGGALALGYIQLVWGVLIKTVDLFRKRRYGEIMFDTAPWLLFAGGVVVALLHKMAGYGLSLTGLFLILLFAGRDSKNILLRLVVGLGTIYNTVTGFISDVLSYSRLFALGLATAIMAAVINIMAFLLWSVPVVGWLLSLLVLIVAHPANLAINSLGAFIHTARLQFVEFFPKFFESGGRKFTPFQTKCKFVNIRDDDLTPPIS